MKWYRPLFAIVLAFIVVSTGVYSAVTISNTHELRYDSNGGANAPDSISFMSGSEITVSDDVPSMKGFVFDGWSLDRFAESGSIQPGDTIRLDADTTLYAIWVPFGDLVILADPGLDDAIAICALFKNIDLFESLTIVGVAGNSNAEISLKNVRKLVELKDMDDRVTIVSTVDIEQKNGDSSIIHGNDCLGDLYKFEPTVGYVDYYDWISGVDHIDWLVSLGGCTVTKMIIDSVDVDNLLLMGGFVNSDPFYGNVEFNQSLDHPAFSYCLTFDHRIATIDTGSDNGPLDVLNLVITGTSIEDNFFKVYQRRCIDAGDAAIAIWDHIAITYLLHPHFFTYERQTDMYGDKLNNLIYICPVYNPGL